MKNFSGFCRHLAPELACLAESGDLPELSALPQCGHSCRPGFCAASDLFANGLNLLAPRSLINGLVREGCYLVTPGWLLDWRGELNAWGFDPPSLKEFSRETFASICLLDTGVLPEARVLLAEAAAHLHLPCSSIPIGLDFLVASLRQLFDKAAESPRRPDSDYAMALDLLAPLVGLADESAVILGVIDLLSSLFAPDSIRLVLFNNDGLAVWTAAGLQSNPDEELHGLGGWMGRIKTAEYIQPYTLLPLDYGASRIGCFALGELAFPAYRDAYCSLMDAIAPVIAVALVNARSRAELETQQRSLQLQGKELRDHLAFRDRLLSIIGHDLRGPIGSLKALLELMVNGTAIDSGMQKDWHQVMYTTANNVFWLLENLLDWGRSTEAVAFAKKEKLSVALIVHKCLDLLRLQASNKGIRMHANIPPDTEIEISEHIFQTILRNVLSNAIKFTGNAGVVRIEAEVRNSEIAIKIIDTGIGMSNATIEAVLRGDQPKKSLGTAGETGTGLGLVLVRDFTARLGGRFSLNSQIGVGTTVQLVFPLGLEDRSGKQVS